MTTILLYGNDKFCSISTDSQVTNTETLQPLNGLPKIIKVNSNIMIAISGCTEAYEKIFGWNHQFPARKRNFKTFFNQKFKYSSADDCFELLNEFAKNQIYNGCKIFVAGVSSTNKMFYGLITTSPYSNKKEESSGVILKYGDLPHDLPKETNQRRYDDHMVAFNMRPPVGIPLDSWINMVVSSQADFIREIALESKFSNNEIYNEIIKLS